MADSKNANSLAIYSPYEKSLFLFGNTSKLEALECFQQSDLLVQKECDVLKTKMKALLEIFKQNPNNYKSLIKAKETAQQPPETLVFNLTTKKTLQSM